MKMFAFSKVSNFGDQLNHWLWPKLLPGGFFTENDERLFLGIGSVLYDSHPANAEKVVFGAGYAGYSALPAIDETWKLYFVRGKNTAAALNLPEDMAVGDSGILIRAVTLPQYEKRFRVSFMPHYESAMFGSWEKICNKLGINFIDPRWDVDVVLEHMLSSELLVSEAMHGVIIADALRVPWKAILPHDPNHRNKWQDWASVLDLNIDFQRLGPSNALEWLMSFFWGKRRFVYALRKRRDKFFSFGFGLPLATAIGALKTASRAAGQLSSDTSIERVTSRMLVELDRLKTDFAPAALTASGAS
ncbi:succinoglycan biosynthesis protein ExoV [Rhizobium pisi]|jgi:succinoglycan biosynthesis protein ExoV|uniref:Polysaccharide pyruvyl transferase family protein n=1 Tax=Rhizobium pisi TaxID=574561 RepID=A0A3R8ZXJ1_9HYPH|nr:polysaccharide pyruvyl transferase family protein [Rhizobium pisi]MBB3137816.1 succinoglycan biosynthesis protein ExoV [Rhizobium pisi]RSB65883.1 polysaccharide pyruvyl transferase family protein [Rhizobium pisi]TCA47710.1 polysaccharide pyruvyl transferase family protein [Rhizobium pisi]